MASKQAVRISCNNDEAEMSKDYKYNPETDKGKAPMEDESEKEQPVQSMFQASNEINPYFKIIRTDEEIV